MSSFTVWLFSILFSKTKGTSYNMQFLLFQFETAHSVKYVFPKTKTGCFLGGRECKLSIIYLSRILCLSSCLSSCRPVIFLSSCHSCGTLSFSLCLSNQTDQGDEREGFEREGYRWRDRRWTDWRGRVWIDFSLFKPNLRNMYVHSATCSYSIELYKPWYTLVDFFPKVGLFAGFSLYIYH